MRSLVFLLSVLVVFVKPIEPLEPVENKITISDIELKILNGSENGCAYLTIANQNSFPVSLYRIEVEPKVFKKLELHDHKVIQDDAGNKVMKMIEIPEIEIAPGVTLFLQPGEKHLMLFGIHPTFCQLEELTFTFFFRGRGQEFTKDVSMKIPNNKRCGTAPTLLRPQNGTN